MSVKKYTDIDYLYLTAMLRARQPNMLSGEMLEQMLDSGSFRECTRILSEAGWPDMSEADSKTIDRLMEKRRSDIFEELAKLVPQKHVLDLFRIRYDYHNAKCVIKAEAADTDAAGLLSDASRVDKEVLVKSFLEDDFRSVPTVLGTAMREAKSVLARTGNPQLADILLDKAFYEEMTQAAAAIDSPYITSYVRLMTDVANLRTAVRCARMKKDSAFVESALIPGGSVRPERIVQALASGEGLTSVFDSSVIREAAALGAEAVKGGHMTAFELECDNAVNRYARDAKLHGFGPEAAVGYLAAEENNITAVRMVLSGLLAGISTQTLKERLRESYV